MLNKIIATCVALAATIGISFAAAGAANARNTQYDSTKKINSCKAQSENSAGNYLDTFTDYCLDG